MRSSSHQQDALDGSSCTYSSPPASPWCHWRRCLLARGPGTAHRRHFHAGRCVRVLGNNAIFAYLASGLAAKLLTCGPWRAATVRARLRRGGLSRRVGAIFPWLRWPHSYTPACMRCLDSRFVPGCTGAAVFLKPSMAALEELPAIIGLAVALVVVVAVLSAESRGPSDGGRGPTVKSTSALHAVELQRVAPVGVSTARRTGAPALST